MITPSRPGLPALPRNRGGTVVLKSGRKLNGTYKGVRPLPADDYARLYAAHRDSLAASIPGLPMLGDTAGLVL